MHSLTCPQRFYNLKRLTSHYGSDNIHVRCLPVSHTLASEPILAVTPTGHFCAIQERLQTTRGAEAEAQAARRAEKDAKQTLEDMERALTQDRARLAQLQRKLVRVMLARSQAQLPG